MLSNKLFMKKPEGSAILTVWLFLIGLCWLVELVLNVGFWEQVEQHFLNGSR